jgi:anti-sigma regulatory factor (Ser/Thr protein kinase)
MGMIFCIENVTRQRNSATNLEIPEQDQEELNTGIYEILNYILLYR